MKSLVMTAASATMMLLAMAAPVATAQESPGSKGPSIESINVEYERELLKIEKHRLEGLGKLALSQPKEQAAGTFDSFFRLAIAKNLYAEADPYAVKFLKAEGPASGVHWLAHLVHIVGEADRGAYEDSLKSLASAIKLGGGQDPSQAAGLSPGTQASIVDAYYQRLIHADQVDVARKAMTLVAQGAGTPAVRELATRRLKQLDLVGKSAPAIAGLDLDGKAFQLKDTKGEVVLVVFWATWCLPNAQEMPWLDYIYARHKSQGFRVVGINLDSSQDGSLDLKAGLPHIRRFLLDYNVTWPTLLNGPAEIDYAKAYGVTEIPANVLIGRDGKVSHLDLGGKRLEKAVAAAIAQKP